MIFNIALNLEGFRYICILCIFFVLCYLIILATRLEQLFKQGSTWQIRIAQILLSLIFAYILTEGITALINSMYF